MSNRRWISKLFGALPVNILCASVFIFLMLKTPTVDREWVLNTLRVLSMLTFIGVNVSDAYYHRRIRQLREEMGLTERL